MRHLVKLALAVAVAGSPGAAQIRATTLMQLTRRAELVLDIVIESVTQQRGRTYVAFTKRTALRGHATLASILHEPTARHCGAALTGLRRGQRFVLFASERTGRIVPIGGARGLVELQDGELAAIATLLAARDDAGRARVLASQLGARSTRVRDDAALALGQLSGLETAGRAIKTRIRDALAGARRESAAFRFGLLEAAARATPLVAAERSWHLLADGRAAGWHAVAHDLLVTRIPRSVVVRSCPTTTHDGAGRLRIARTLAALHDIRARSLLEQFAGAADPNVGSEACAALLELGANGRTLGARVGTDRVRRARLLIEQRRSAPRWRAIDPR